MSAALPLPLHERWSVSAMGGPHAPVLGADGRVFVMVEGRLAALDADSGETAWTYPLGRPVALHGAYVVATASRDELHLVEARTGRPEGCLHQRWAEAVLAAGPGLLALNGGFAGALGSLALIDVASGQRRWAYRFVVGSVHQDGPPPTVVTDDLVVVGERDGQVTALALESGAVRWRRSWPEWGEPTPDGPKPAKVDHLLLEDRRLVVDAGGHCAGLSLDDGRSLWEQEGGAQALDGGRLYAAVAGNQYHVRAIADGGSVRKALAAGAPPPMPSILTSSTVALLTGTHAFVTTGDGILVAVERDTGRYAWHHQPAAWGRVGPPLVVDGRLLYRNGDRLHCLAPEARP